MWGYNHSWLDILHGRWNTTSQQLCLSAQNPSTSWSTASLFFCSLNHLFCPSLSQLKMHLKRCTNKNDVPQNNMLLLAHTVSTLHSTRTLVHIFLAWSFFQLRDLLLIHKILGYPTWEVCPCCSRIRPLNVCCWKKHTPSFRDYLSLKSQRWQCVLVITITVLLHTPSSQEGTMPVHAFSSISVPSTKHLLLP